MITLMKSFGEYKKEVLFASSLLLVVGLFAVLLIVLAPSNEVQKIVMQTETRGDASCVADSYTKVAAPSEATEPLFAGCGGFF